MHIWPDPNEVGRVWRADLAMPCEPAAVVRALLAKGAPPNAAKRKAWVDNLHAVHKRVTKAEWQPMTDGVNFAAVIAEINTRLTDDATVTSDAGNFATFVHRYLLMKPGQMFLASVVGAMGAGLPMGVAACLRRPGTQVIAFAGDGGALMTGNELATARQYNVNPVFIVSDNNGYGTILQHHDARYPGRPSRAATQLTNPDFTIWATAFGAKGLAIHTEDEIAPVIAEALSTKDRPVVVHVHTSMEQISAWRRRSS